MEDDWSYEKWVKRIELYATDEHQLYTIVNEIYEQGYQDGYGYGFGDGKVCCGGSCCECGPSDG